MKKYYSERNGLLPNDLELDLAEVCEAFYKIFKYFKEKDAFVWAFKGQVEYDNHTGKSRTHSPKMKPEPSLFFMNVLQDKQVWPIEECYYAYSIDVLFSVIEILHDNIGYYNEEEKTNEVRAEYDEMINNILKLFEDGYYLEPTHGIIIDTPNEALKHQLKYDGDDLPKDVLQEVRNASKMYYRFDSSLTDKKAAIEILAGILENVRYDLQDILNEKFEISKKGHDKLIFDIINGFSIRHNRSDQKNNYSHEIWYDWMMQYYTSVIITYFKLIKDREKEINNI